MRLLERRRRLRAASRGRAGRGGVSARPRRTSRAAPCAGRTSSTGRRSPRSPSNSTIRISFALLSASLGLWKEAIAACRQVLAGEPEDVVAAAACSTLAEALRAEGKARGGGALRPGLPGEASLEDLPGDRATTSSRRPRGVGEDLDSALDYAGRALSAAPDELKPYPLATLGWVHYKRQEFDRAIDCLRRSSERAAAADDVPSPRHGLPRRRASPRRPRPPSRKAKTVARGGALEDRMLQQVRSNIRLVEKVGREAEGSQRRPGRPEIVSRESVRRSRSPACLHGSR